MRNIPNTIQPELQMIKLPSDSVEELLKTRKFPKSYKDDDKKRIRCILKLIRDINLSILFRESFRVRCNTNLFEHTTKLIVKDSQKLRFR